MARSTEQGSGSSSGATGIAADAAARVLVGQDRIREWQEGVYRALHQHPELSDMEVHTAATAADALRTAEPLRISWTPD